VEQLSDLRDGIGVPMPASLRILVVESHALVAAALGGLLCEPPLAAEVEIVRDGEAAIARLDEADFDLVVCELSVPPRSATAVMSRLAALGCVVPVVLLSDAEEEPLLLDAMTSLIEPLLIVFLGVIVGGIVIAMFLPIFKLNEVVSQSKS